MPANNIVQNVKRNQSGFSTAAAIAVIVFVFLVAIVGAIALKTNSKAPAATSKSTTKTTDDQDTTSNKVINTVTISELGVKLTNVPDSIKDLTYILPEQGASDYKSAYFTTPSLEKLNADCSIGALATHPGTHTSADDSASELATYTKQFDSFWIATVHVDAACGEAGSASSNLQGTQIEAFMKLVSDNDNIELAK